MAADGSKNRKESKARLSKREKTKGWDFGPKEITRKYGAAESGKPTWFLGRKELRKERIKAGQIAVHANACWCSDRHAAKRGKGLKRLGYLLCGKNLFRSIARVTLCSIKIARRRKKVVEVCAGSVGVRRQGHCALLLDGRFTAPSCVALVV